MIATNLMTTITERFAYERYLGTLRGGTPEYNRSELASQWTQKVQLLRDIQVERRDIKEKLKKNKARTLFKVSLILTEKNVASRALNLIGDFLASRVMPISNTHVVRAQKIERTNQAKARHIVQGWKISNDPAAHQRRGCFTHHHHLSAHHLAVSSENTLADLNSSRPTMRLPGGSMAPKNYTEYKKHMIQYQSIPALKELCRVRYLKVGGKKSVLIERLMAEKW